ncbi:Acyl-CoA-binding domain-containing protein 5 [Xenopus (Silurana) tropicalis] [Rhizoctonia solani]|uniref:Acyl-CoA-binding domain-containing protein 5 [Xenopus (Silurana) tropicalis] n=1 Tax=Rhizoctonia solani TaxID=456999 RepID=A0A0K6FVN3_9AGAM|nr:Acyl-CoA-binding domain-containing protein 5 [Xenopus (Silurana) tropicalis] [Rhizoctonia solani]
MDIDTLVNAQFNRAVEIVQSLPKTGPIQTGYEEKLAMYSLYKQATQGNVKTSRPGVWDMLGRAKWDEWAKLGQMDTREAQWRYVETLKKVLRKYPDRTIAKDLIAELDSFAGDPNNLVMSSHSNMGASTSFHERAETSSSGSSRTQGSPPPVHAALLEAQKQHFAHVQRPTDTTVFESSEDDETTESDTDGEAENAPVPPLQPQQRANSPPISPTGQGPMPVVAGVPLTQPQPRYAAPSAFAPLAQQHSALAFSPQQPTHSLHPAYHPHMPPEALGSYQGHSHLAYQDAPRSRSPPRGTTSMGLERAIVDIQASLAALRERMETMEQGGSFTSSYSSRRQSPPRRHSPLHPMLPFNLDPRSFGAWSVILTPLARSVVNVRHMLQVVRRNPTMIIIRRLMLDISFLLALLAVIRACWRRFGGRRREIISALGGMWIALVNGGQAPRERILVDRGI